LKRGGYLVLEGFWRDGVLGQDCEEEQKKEGALGGLKNRKNESWSVKEVLRRELAGS
jgi:hypothetical protein